MYDDNRLEFGTKYCCDVFNNNRNEKQITKGFRLKIRGGGPTFFADRLFFRYMEFNTDSMNFLWVL